MKSGEDIFSKMLYGLCVQVECFGDFACLVFKLHCKCILENVSHGLGNHGGAGGTHKEISGLKFSVCKNKSIVQTSTWARAKKLKESTGKSQFQKGK